MRFTLTGYGGTVRHRPATRPTVLPARRAVRVRSRERCTVPSREPALSASRRPRARPERSGASPVSSPRPRPARREQEQTRIGERARDPSRLIEQRASHDAAAPLRDRESGHSADTASMRLSVSSCITRRPRLTPSAIRTAISRRRLSARASNRFATLAHAMSNTITATPPSQVATLASFPALGPRSRSTGPANARGFASANGVVLGCASTCFL